MSSLFSYIEKEMHKYPNQTLTDGIKTLSYAQLLADAQSQAELLTKPKYGILCEKSLNTVAAVLACFCAGKTAVLLSSRYGRQHCASIIAKTRVSYLITDQGIHCLSEDVREKENLSGVALLMCTSGTTGKPKAAMITEENLIANLEDIRKYFKIDSDDRILISRPLYHCAVLTGEFLVSLLLCVQIHFFEGSFNPSALLSRIQNENITVFCGTPTLLYHLSSFALRFHKQLSLKKIVISGECMTERAARKIREAFPNADIYHVYGLTEASPRVSFLPPELFDKAPCSVGFPLASLTCRVDGGELLVSGKSVMRGYYEDPLYTKQALSGGWLHTGDLADINADGLITIHGRKDNMIIRSGMNIYPAEIENKLLEDENVQEIIAFGVPDKTVGQRIYIKAVSSLTKEKLFALCREKLSPVQYPDEIELVDKLLKNASGKLIRRQP